MKRIILASVLLCLPILAHADSVDEAVAKRRGVSIEKIQIEKLQQANDDLRDVIVRLRAEVAQLKADLTVAIKSGSDQANKAKAEAASALAELEKTKHELSLYKPSNNLMSVDGFADITSTQLEAMPEKFKDKPVRMLNVRFRDINTIWIDNLPGVTVSSNGLVSIVNTGEIEKWIGFSVADSNGKSFSRFFAQKEKFGDFIVSLKGDQHLNLAGFVIPLDRTTNYGFICTKIELVPVAERKPK